MVATPLVHEGWLLIFGPAMLLGLAVLLLLRRRSQLRDYARSVADLAEARQRGTHAARLQHPEIDLSQCIGCGSCVRACPEDGVLSVLHGQAVVIHGARCVGHGLCAAACPTGAISLTLADLSTRRDLPALDSTMQAVGVPGLFLAGELSGFALVRTAVAQGIAAADAAARRVATHSSAAARVPVTVAARAAGETGSDQVLDLLIVGAGPGGLACSLRAKEHELHFLTIEQEPMLGGTVAAYPRRKMVMTQPVDLPMHGRLPKLTYQKEELIELWQHVAAKNHLPIRTGVKLTDLARSDDGTFIATTSDGPIHARNVCLALGRRGSPRKLGVPGEDLPKVAYSLLDAESYQGRRVLVVGGGDSAIEAALGLSEQPGNQVTISYRKDAFTRLKTRNDSRIAKAIQENRVRVLFNSEVLVISSDRVRLAMQDGGQEPLENDEVFIFAGGDPPFALLERAGVSFDPADRPEPPEIIERGTGLLSALTLAFLCAVVLSIWSVWFAAYYGIEGRTRFNSALHPLLRPTGPVGLWSGLLACALICWNLSYLVRRWPRWGSWLPGSLRLWMGSHVFTGLLAALFVLVHSGFTMRPTVGGHALVALALVVLSGSIGRYWYAMVPRAANGTEASLGELRTQLAGISAEWDRGGRGFGTRVRQQIDELITKGRWRPSLLGRIIVLAAGQFHLSRNLRQLRQLGANEGIPEAEVSHVLILARKAYRLTLLVTHYEEVSALLSSWRYFHRWLGLLMVLLTIVHVVTAFRYGTFTLGFTNLFTGGSP